MVKILWIMRVGRELRLAHRLWGRQRMPWQSTASVTDGTQRQTSLFSGWYLLSLPASLLVPSSNRGRCVVSGGTRLHLMRLWRKHTQWQEQLNIDDTGNHVVFHVHEYHHRKGLLPQITSWVWVKGLFSSHSMSWCSLNCPGKNKYIYCLK